MKRLRVATCQFSVEPKIAHNCKYVLAQIDQAADRGADVAHFPECVLSGYAGLDFPDIAALDFDELRAANQDVMAAAKRQKIWVLLGSMHFLDEITSLTIASMSSMPVARSWSATTSGSVPAKVGRARRSTCAITPRGIVTSFFKSSESPEASASATTIASLNSFAS